MHPRIPSQPYIELHLPPEDRPGRLKRLALLAGSVLLGLGFWLGIIGFAFAFSALTAPAAFAATSAPVREFSAFQIVLIAIGAAVFWVAMRFGPHAEG